MLSVFGFSLMPYVDAALLVLCVLTNIDFVAFLVRQAPKQAFFGRWMWAWGCLAATSLLARYVFR